MGNVVKVRLNRSGVRELLKSGDMLAACAEQADRVRSACGDGYESNTHVGNRATAMVWPQSAKARQDNYRNNTLVKVVESLRVE